MIVLSFVFAPLSRCRHLCLFPDLLLIFQAEFWGAINKKLTRRFVSYICPAFVVSYVLALYSFLILGNREIDIEETLIGELWYLKALAIFVCIQAVLVKCKNVMLEWIIIVIAESLFLVGWKLSPFLYELFCLEHCFFFCPFFMMGYYFRRYNLMEVVKSKNWMFTISLVGFYMSVEC